MEYIKQIKVKSTSDGRRFYKVSLNKKREWSCSCRGWIYHRHCKHTPTN